MAAIIILVNREIVNPGWFLPKNVIYVVKKLATVIFEDFIWEGGGEGGWGVGGPIPVNRYHIRNSQNSYL